MKTVRSQAIKYGIPTSIVVPQIPKWLGVSAQLDPNSGKVKARVVWLEDSGKPQRKQQNVLLLRGDAPVEFADQKNFSFIALTSGENKRHAGIATLWACDPVKQPISEAPQEPKPKKNPEPPSPDSLAAIHAHEHKLKLEADAQKELEAAEAEIQKNSTQFEKPENELVAALKEDLKVKDVPWNEENTSQKLLDEIEDFTDKAESLKKVKNER